MYLQEIEIRYKKRVITEGPICKPIQEARQAVDLFSEYRNDSEEKMMAICLDAKAKILCFEVFRADDISLLYSRPMQVFRTAFPVNAFAAIVLHFQLSRDPLPCPEDVDFARKLLRISKNMGLLLYDFIAFDMSCYYSFAEHGICEG